MPLIQKSAAAREDLINIWRYTYTNWGEPQADLYNKELENALSLLADAPLICRLREEISPPVRIHHFRKHLVVYVEVEGGINLIRILHESSDYESHLEGSI